MFRTPMLLSWKCLLLRMNILKGFELDDECLTYWIFDLNDILRLCGISFANGWYLDANISNSASRW